LAGPSTFGATPVSNGVFTVTLDLGSGLFTGAKRFLEIGVHTNGGGAFTTLTPRQKITAAPYAVTAGALPGVVSSADRFSFGGTFWSTYNLRPYDTR
jgi:hypothetical protein